MGWCPQQLKDIVEYHESVDVEKYEMALQDLRLDVAIAPLLNSKFNHSKSNLKWLEYSACGVPTIASDVVTYAEIDDGHTGMLENTQQDWYGALTHLIDNPGALVVMGEEANNWCRTHYDLSITSKAWLAALQANHEFQRAMFNTDDDLKNRIAESHDVYKDVLRRTRFYNKVRTKIRRKTKHAKRKGYNTHLPF